MLILSIRAKNNFLRLHTESQSSTWLCWPTYPPPPHFPILTCCLEAAELMLMLLQPAWQGERYSTPLSPQTGWKMDFGHKQSLRQAGGCGCIELDVLPTKQEARNQTKRDQETAPHSSSARVPGLADVPACLCLSWASATLGSELSPWEPVMNLPLFGKHGPFHFS